ncbi:MAG: LD-carboxypeptidase [Flavobacteriales bacterium]|nr:LD-carboxypeptidase [Flavobacteriales bacterium]
MQIPFLNQNDHVAIVAPAGRFDPDKITFGIETLKAWGLQVSLAKNLNVGHHKFSGTDAQRLADFQEALDDEKIKAIFCARGGYGSIRIIDQLDFSNFLRKPKWIIGFSDITVLHNYINLELNVPTIHGPMPASFVDNTPGALETLKTYLFQGKWSSEVQLNETVEGSIVGGNLSIVHSMLGSTITPERLRNKILFLEEIDEYLYHIERMFFSLKRAGIFETIKGLVLGGFTDIKDNDTPFDKSIQDIAKEVCPNRPIVYDYPSGHITDNHALPFGIEVQISPKKIGFK